MKLHLFSHVNGLEGWDWEGRKQHLHVGHMVEHRDIAEGAAGNSVPSNMSPLEH